MARSNSQGADLGPVPFRLELRAEARPARPGREAPPSMPAMAGGALSDLQALVSRKWKGALVLGVGPAVIPLDLKRDLDIVEELVVFLLELVDSGHGELSLVDGDHLITVEAQVFGPDVTLEFADEEGRAPRFRGQNLPRRASVRLRAVVEQGTAVIENLLELAAGVEEGFSTRTEVGQLRQDLRTLLDATAHQPAAFRSGDRA